MDELSVCMEPLGVNLKSFKEYIVEMQNLTEKLLVIGKGAKYGQVIFLAGGAGSGKGFAISNFLEGSKYKVRDVDEWKQSFLKIAVLQNKYPEIRKLDLRKPKDVFALHMFVKEKNIKDKSLNIMLNDAKRGRLPNIIFDITLKDKEDITNTLPQLLKSGYNPKDIHVVWVLTDYHIAVQQNKKRSRVVPDDILLKTHEGAAGTMWKFINSGTPAALDGSVHVILGGAKHTVFWKDADGKPLDGTRKGKYGTDQVVIKDFKYLTLKQPGKNMDNDAALKSKILSWIRENTPKTLKNKGMFGSGLQEQKQSNLPKLYVDMDQVLVNFLDGAENVLGKPYTDKEYWMKDSSGDKKALLTKKAPNFFRDLDWMPDGKQLWNFISKHRPNILSAHPTKWMPNSKKDKATWLSRNAKGTGDIHLVKREDKQKYAIASSGQPNILIDDHPKNIKEWQAKGGVGILHRSAKETIAKLKKMGF